MESSPSSDEASPDVSQDPNACVLLSVRSHLSGVSVRFDLGDYIRGTVMVELWSINNGDPEPLRTMTIDLSKFDSGDTEHLYWEPIEDSKDRAYLLRFTLSQDCVQATLSPPRLLAAKLAHSQPGGYESLPQALLWSPVSQCNLNCTHCISRSTRNKRRFASQRTWDAVWQITRHKKFSHLAMDFSGDILFSERKYPGTLAKIIQLNAKFRMDTNGTCLDDDIIDMLFASQIYELNFSIDSMDPEVYRKIRRGSLPLHEVLAKIEHFMERKRAAQKQIYTIMTFVLMRSNAPTIKPAIAFARDNGIDIVNVVPMLAFTDDMIDEIFVWDEVAFAALRRDLSTEATRLGVTLAIHDPVKRWRDEDIHAPCEIPFATATITANGDVWACCMPGSIIGNLNKQSLYQIWNGPAFAAFRKRVNTPNPPAPCRNCGLSHALVRNNHRAYAPALYAKPSKDEPGKYPS